MKAVVAAFNQEKALVGAQGVGVANLVRELIIGIEMVCDGGKPKYAINRTVLDKNFHNINCLRP